MEDTNNKEESKDGSPEKTPNEEVLET